MAWSWLHRKSFFLERCQVFASPSVSLSEVVSRPRTSMNPQDEDAITRTLLTASGRLCTAF